MSDVVIVALISSATAIIVALIPQMLPARKDSAATNGDSIAKLKKENGALKKANKEKQEIIDYYRKKEQE